MIAAVAIGPKWAYVALFVLWGLGFLCWCFALLFMRR